MQGGSARPARRRFTADEFEHLATAGVLHEDDRLELLDGDIVEMTPISTRHAGAVNALTTIFAGPLGKRAVVAVQNPVRLDDFNEPRPDLCVLRAREDCYRTAHPRADDVLLLVEVAHTSLRYDQSIKAPLYGRYGVPETWIVDVEQRIVHVFRDPASDGYRSHQQYGADESLVLDGFPDLVIEIGEIVGRD